MSTYIPHPTPLGDQPLPEDLRQAIGLIAQDVHEVWARGRIAQGWTYGPELDHTAKTHPSLVEYSRLPESEREFDLRTTEQVIRMLLHLGYRITKDAPGSE